MVNLAAAGSITRMTTKSDSDTCGPRHGIHLPPFGALADPRAIADIAQAAEQYGWDGLFVWDHVLNPFEGEWDIADPWIVLAAAATVTRQIRLGPMVTPLARRRVMKVARETVSLDRLSRGRLTLGLGLGTDLGREFSAFGDVADAKQRAQVLDDSTETLTRLWSGATVDYAGSFLVDRVRAIPGPIQQPRVPIWFGSERGNGAPIKRAARYDGVFPYGLDAQEIARLSDTIVEIRGDLDNFDIAVSVRPGADVDAMSKAGATWLMHAFWIDHTPDQIVSFIESGPPA